MSRPRRGDLVAGVTVAMVLVPQSIAYAALAGLPPQAGLYAAAAAPLLAAPVGSSPYLQTGPVALTSLLVVGALAPVAPTGGPEYVALAALLALVVGAVRVLVGVTRTGVVAYLMSQPVVTAFTLAAAALIVCSQVPALVGLDSSTVNPVSGAAGVLATPSGWSPAALGIAVAVGTITLAVRRVNPLVPGALLGSLAAVVLVRWTSLDVPLVGDIPSGFPVPTLDLPWSQLPALLLPGLVIALIGFAEPASIARQYAGADRSAWDPDREFVGQGLANLGAGLVGGYPVGGSFSRSALNRLSGARTRWSGFVTGACVAAVLPFSHLLAGLPDAALAGLVIASVLPLLDPRPVLRTWRLSRPQLVWRWSRWWCPWPPPRRCSGGWWPGSWPPWPCTCGASSASTSRCGGRGRRSTCVPRESSTSARRPAWRAWSWPSSPATPTSPGSSWSCSASAASTSPAHWCCATSAATSAGVAPRWW